MNGQEPPVPRVTDGCNPPAARPTRAPDTAWGKLRGDLGLSIRDWAERTGINRGEISRIERGRLCPTPEQADRLLTAYRGAGQ